MLLESCVFFILFLSDFISHTSLLSWNWLWKVLIHILLPETISISGFKKVMFSGKSVSKLRFHTRKNGGFSLYSIGISGFTIFTSLLIYDYGGPFQKS